MSGLRVVASNPAPERAGGPSVMELLDEIPDAELIRFCVDSGVLERTAKPSRSELVTALFQVQRNVRVGQALLAKTGAVDAKEASARLEEWRAGAERAEQLGAELMALARKGDANQALEVLIAEGRRAFKLSPAMANTWRKLHQDGEATVGSLRNMLDELKPIPALANGRA